MSLTKVTKDYEILIRFNENGKIGIQQQKITTVFDGDEYFSSKLEEVQPLALKDIQSLVSAWTDVDIFVPTVSEEAE